MVARGWPLFLVLLGAAALSTQPAAGAEGGMSQLDVNKSTIQATMSALPAEDAVLIEFFASWCPACRAFKPEYEKAATFLLKHSSVHVYRLDCAVDPDVCDKYKVAGYPTMYVGKAADIAAVAVDKLTKFDYGLFKRNAAGVVQFVAKQLSLDLTYAEEAQASAAPATAASQQGNSSSTAAVLGTTKWTAVDVESATRQLFTSITSFHPTEGLKERRAALLLLLRLWGAAHPLGHCRSGAASLMQQLPQLWPEDATKDPWGADQGSTQHPPADVCAATSTPAAPPPGAQYVACKGSTADSRGFTCGLWLLFHTTASRLPEKDGGALLVAALQGFTKYFFQCEVCRTHFMKITSAPEAAAVRSRRDGVIWLWKVHNEVNARLKQVESKHGHSSTGDPAFPKVQWPTAADCPLCRLPQPEGSSAATQAADSVQWNEGEVHRYLMQHYGRQPDGAASTTATPVGAQRSTDGGSAIMQAALEAEEAAKASASPLRWLTSTAGMCTVLVVAVVLACLMQHVDSGRRSLGMKGPGAQRFINGRHGRGATLRIRAGLTV